MMHCDACLWCPPVGRAGWCSHVLCPNAGLVWLPPEGRQVMGLDKDELFLDESMAPNRTSSDCHLLHTQQTCYPKLNSMVRPGGVYFRGMQFQVL